MDNRQGPAPSVSRQVLRAKHGAEEWTRILLANDPDFLAFVCQEQGITPEQQRDKAARLIRAAIGERSVRLNALKAALDALLMPVLTPEQVQQQHAERRARFAAQHEVMA